MQKYICTACDYIYDPAIGDPDNGIEAGTAFEDITRWLGMSRLWSRKEDFEPYEE